MANIARARSHSHNFNCLHCGIFIECGDYNPMSPTFKLMQRKQMCFTCSFWNDKIERPHPHQQIIKGEYYLFRPWVKADDRRTVMGSGGKSFYIRLNDGLVLRSNDMLSHGKIPETFLSAFPDTAKFITKKAYYKIKQHPYFKCKSKGCWDRYHCFWYDVEMETNGPWNKIPPSHKIGEEYCESFLNKNKVYE